jgi:hypothetical protein
MVNMNDLLMWHERSHLIVRQITLKWLPAQVHPLQNDSSIQTVYTPLQNTEKSHSAIVIGPTLVA